MTLRFTSNRFAFALLGALALHGATWLALPKSQRLVRVIVRDEVLF